MTVQLRPYLMMEGNARKAIQFYEKVLGAEILGIQTYGEMAIPCPDAYKEYVANATLKVGDIDLTFSDSPGMPVQVGNQIMISLTVENAGKAKHIFEALQEDGQVNSPLEATPFSPAFGNVTDQFGNTFQIVAENH
ncbi:MAG TPA: VOC family protein [Bacillales bacterium]|nr:VOC family protein [Bacillales bacterium]